MAKDGHLRREDFQAERDGHDLGAFAVRAHGHLTAVCPDCGETWQQLGQLRGGVEEGFATLEPFVAPAAPHHDNLPGTTASIGALHAQAAELRALKKQAKKELSYLRRLPAHQRAATVRRAYRRFQSRWLAVLLIEESRALVRNDPAEAESFASLVPLVLDWARAEPWAPALLARAAAHRANALRVAGDLPAADRQFGKVATALGGAPTEDLGLVAELASLEGSLRIGQRRTEEAEDLLARAALAYELIGDTAGLARTWIQQANLLQALGRPEEVVALLDQAEAALGAEPTPYLTVCTVTGRVNALCDLDRPAEARSLLRRHLDAFEEDDDLHTAALLRGLEGRVAFGLAEHAASEGWFRSARDGMLAAGRAFDAALATLDLAQALCAQGRNRELRELASGLLREFRSRGVAREALAVLQLFVRAVAAEELTAASLADLRRRLSRASARPEIV